MVGSKIFVRRKFSNDSKSTSAKHRSGTMSPVGVSAHRAASDVYTVILVIESNMI